MYIAGIHLSNDHLTEGIVTSSLLAVSAATVVRNIASLKTAEEKGGKIKSLPTTLLGKFITPVHGAAMILPSLAYLIAVPLSGGVQPAFITRFSLPKFDLDENVINALRIVGCVGLFATYRAFNACEESLGQSFHFIGVREKPKITSSGPYSVVRHPLYLSALARQLALLLLTWNYIPFGAFAVCAASFAIKIPIEEQLIESDAQAGPEYAEYKKKVPYRLIPKVW